MQNNINDTSRSQNLTLPDQKTPPATTDKTEKKPRLESRPPSEIITDSDGRRFRNGVELFCDDDSDNSTVKESLNTHTTASTTADAPKQPRKTKPASAQVHASSQANVTPESVASQCQRLQSAIKSGDIQTVKQLIDQNPHLVAEADKSDVAPVFEAVSSGQSAIAELLVQSGASTTYQDKSGSTALHLAITGGHISLAEALIRSGTPVNQADHEGVTPLMLAARKGHPSIAQLLIDNKATVEQTNNQGKTSLAIAAEHGHTKIIELLISEGASVNRSDNRGETPLMLACVKNHPNVVELLLPNLPDRAAIDIGDHSGSPPLFFAVEGRNIKIIKLLLDHGATIDIQDPIGLTALMVASAVDYTEVVELLVARGAKLGQTNIYGMTALFLACRCGKAKAAALLLEKTDFSLSLPTQFGSMVKEAALNGHAEVLKILFEKAFFISKISSGTNKYLYDHALCLAISNGHHEALAVLLKNMGRPDASSEAIWSSINGAAANGHTEVVRMIFNEFSSSLPLSSPGLFSGTPAAVYELLQESLINAILQDHYDIASLLIKAGAKPDYKDELGNSALSEAIHKGNLKIVMLLLEQDVKLSRRKPDDKMSNEVLLAISSDTPDPLLIDALLDFENTHSLKKGSFGFALNFDQIFAGVQKLLPKSYSGTSKSSFPQTAIANMLCTEFGLSYLISDALSTALKNIMDVQFASSTIGAPPSESQLRMAFTDIVASTQILFNLTRDDDGPIEKYYDSHAQAPALARKLARTASTQAELLNTLIDTAVINYRDSLRTYLDNLTPSTQSQQIQQFMQQAGWHPLVTGLVAECWESLNGARTKDTLFTAIGDRLNTPEFAEKFDQLPSDTARQLLGLQMNRLQAIMQG